MPHLRKFYRILPILIVALFAGYAVFNTVMNNAYQFGASFYDSAEFATVIWHSGIRLDMGPVFAGSIYTTHASTINYLPGIASYIFPGDFMDYYGLVYGILLAATMVGAYVLFLPLAVGPMAAWVAALGAFMLFCSQIYFDGIWELRSDYAAPLFMMVAFRYWQLRNYKISLLGFILFAMVREDLGLMVVLPIALLAAIQYYQHRRADPVQARERVNWAFYMCIIMIVWECATIYIQKRYFPHYDLIQDQYYNWEHPFAHLSSGLLNFRFNYLLYHGYATWLPMVVLIVAAFWLWDLELIVGAIAFLPYFIGCFFSKSYASSLMLSYKPFLFALVLFWPAIIYCGKPESLRKRYAIIQCIVLVCSVLNIRFMHMDLAMMRWFPQPLTYNAQLYRDFGKNDLPKEAPLKTPMAVSQSILALYPYQFPHYWQVWIRAIKIEDMDKVKTVIWFQGDKDQQDTDKLLSRGKFDITRIAGTKICVAHRAN